MICVSNEKKRPPSSHSLYRIHGSLHYRFGKTSPAKKNLNVKILLKPREKIKNRVIGFPMPGVVRNIGKVAFLISHDFLNLNRNLRVNK